MGCAVEQATDPPRKKQIVEDRDFGGVIEHPLFRELLGQLDDE